MCVPRDPHKKYQKTTTNDGSNHGHLCYHDEENAPIVLLYLGKSLVTMLLLLASILLCLSRCTPVFFVRAIASLRKCSAANYGPVHVDVVVLTGMFIAVK